MKIDRLVSIIMILNNKEKVTAKELSEKFEVSTKTIQRDMEIIARAGIPIVSYKGHRGGYGIIAGYKVNKSSMTGGEANFLKKLLMGINKSYENKEATTLINKLEVIQPEKHSSLNDRLIIDFSTWGKSEELTDEMNIIDEAIKNKNPIEFDYVNGSGEKTSRQIEPYKIIFKSLAWYVYGFCNLKNEMRVFKVNRMENIKVKNENFIYNEKLMDDLFIEKEIEKIKVTIRIPSKMKEMIKEGFPEYKLIEEKDGFIIAIIKVPSGKWIEGMILSFGDCIEVLTPLDLRKSIKEKINSMNKLYK
ncbi:YafY family protein [uncultured Clostridium sp.]|uniref:helix-turn-helix transcriptional regulator n=1 Tax=uncultured Clostridium sp. TaxID=59620 RepID=UPI0032163969